MFRKEKVIDQKETFNMKGIIGYKPSFLILFVSSWFRNWDRIDYSEGSLFKLYMNFSELWIFEQILSTPFYDRNCEPYFISRIKILQNNEPYLVTWIMNMNLVINETPE